MNQNQALAQLTYKTIIKRLEKELALTLRELPLDTKKEKVQNRLSMAKHRLGVEGRLSFEWVAEAGTWTLSLVLQPSPTASLPVGSITGGL